MAPRNSSPGIWRRNTTPSENIIRSIVAPATHQNIAFLRISGGRFLVAIPMRIALSPLMTRSMRMILSRAKAPAEVKRCMKSDSRVMMNSDIVKGLCMAIISNPLKSGKNLILLFDDMPDWMMDQKKHLIHLNSLEMKIKMRPHKNKSIQLLII